MENKYLSFQEQQEFLFLLRNRFEKYLHRHKDIDWDKVEIQLLQKPDKLGILNEMERTGGEPDVVHYDPITGEYIFYDCSPETPKGRRGTCYDKEGQESRKEYKPENNAIDMAKDMGIDILTEVQYRELQALGEFDVKTSSWVYTPTEIRKLGGALFCDRRYNQVFIYHNGAQSYYAVRGFRGVLRV